MVNSQAIGDVEPDRMHALLRILPQFSQRHVPVLLVAVGERDFHAGGGQNLDQAQTDAAAAAGHKRYLAIQVLHRLQPSPIQRRSARLS